MADIESREDVKGLVDAFYEKVLADPELAPFFTQVVQLDFDHHMPRLYDFWESTLFYKAGYQGNPMEVHQNLNAKSKLEKKHFDRWLELFRETVDELFDGQRAELAKTRALSIATVMQMKIGN